MFISAYGPGIEKSEEEIEEFWNELSECVGSFGRNASVVVLGDLNARVGNEVTEGIVGRHLVPGRNESLEMCAEQVLVVGNSWFKKNDVYKYTWLRMSEGRMVDKALMDYVLLPRRMLVSTTCYLTPRRLPHVTSLSLTMFRPPRHLISSNIYFSPVIISYPTTPSNFVYKF